MKVATSSPYIEKEVEPERVKPVPHSYRPGIFHHFYFIRNGIYKGIERYKGEMTGRMMDFGCGAKPYRSLFNVDEYIGVDYNGEGHSHENEQIDVFYDGRNIPFPDDHFDSILSTEVFEHIFNLDEVLDELNRVLKPGAKILVTVPFVWNEHETPVDFGRYSSFGIRHMLEKHGFEIEKLDKSTNFIETLFQLGIAYFYLHILNGPLKRWYKVGLFRRVLNLFFIAIPVLMGKFFSRVLPDTDDFYHNNIVLARKKMPKV